MNELNGSDCQHIVERMHEVIYTHRDALSELDAAIGDGDHGANLEQALRAANHAVAALVDPLPGAIFELVGKTLRNQMGGAAGIIFGTFFTSGGSAIEGKSVLALADIYRFVESGIAGVKKRGRAEAGDKTILDTLLPVEAALSSAIADARPLDQALAAAAAAGQEGALTTKQMVARHGRAKYLGERALGHQDAGAASMAHLIAAWADIAAE